MPIATADDRRAVPRFDGREPAPPSAGDVLLWIPRVVLAPLYFVAELLIRRPLAWLVPFIEEADLPQRMLSFFRFGKNEELMLTPTFSYDLGFRPNVGLLFKWDDAGSEHNQLRYHFAFGGVDWISTAIVDRYEVDDLRFAVRGSYVRRADGTFWEIGGQGADAIRSRYDWESALGELSLGADLSGQSRVLITTALRWQRFGHDPAWGVPTLARVDEGVLDALPPGFNCEADGSNCEGFMVHATAASFVVDSRADRPAPGHGVRWSAGAEVAYDVRQGADDLLYVKYGSALEGFIDLTGRQHLLGLGLSTSFSDALAGEVPFTELARLSDDGPMRGFLGNHLIGQSAIAASLTYHWPVWALLDGSMHVAVGNTFGRHLDGFEWDKLRMSFGFGVAAVDRRDHFFEILVGFGTNTFENGARIDSVRFFVGGTRAF